jgi:hypothetical protein
LSSREVKREVRAGHSLRAEGVVKGVQVEAEVMAVVVVVEAEVRPREDLNIESLFLVLNNCFLI